MYALGALLHHHGFLPQKVRSVILMSVTCQRAKQEVCIMKREGDSQT